MVNDSLLFGVLLIFTIIVNVPQSHCLEEQIKRFAFNTNGLGTYSFEYETSKGTYRKEDGGVMSDPEGASLFVRGEYGYIDTEGKLYTMKYIADKNGYHPFIDGNDIRYNDRRII